MRKYEIVAAIAGLCLGLMATALLLAPRLTARFPDGVVHSAVQPITLTFNRRVLLDSAVHHFQLAPPVSGQFEVLGKRLLFTPSAPLSYGQTYTVTLAAGVRGENRLPLLRGSLWQFQVAGPNLLYLRQDADGRSALWLQSVDGSFESVRLTGPAVDVWDYLVTADGRSVLITNVAGEQGDELLLFHLGSGEQQLLLACPESRCREARPQPGGQLVAYERADLASGSGARQVWLLDRVSGGTWPVHPEELLESAGIRTQLSHSARWSADGRYLAYFKPDAYALVILDMAGGIPLLLPANVNEIGEWSPFEYRLTYTEFVELEPELFPIPDSDAPELADDHAFFANLVLVDLNADESLKINGGPAVHDGPGTWHPEGRWMAFTRSSGVGGRQIWLLDIGDLSVKALTNEITSHHSALSWSPDGRYLAFMRSSIDYSTAVPSLWLYDREMDSMALQVTEAFRPQWQR
jgi:Tol biopolymer transport system component